MINGILKWSMENRLLVVALGVVLFLFGAISTVNTPIDVLPEFAPPQVVIQTQAPGFAAEEVEATVTLPLESALNGAPKVQAIRSSSIEGLSFITVIFDWGTDVFNARQFVLERIQPVSSRFPLGVRTPILSPISSPAGNIYFFALTSKQTPMLELRSFADWEIKNKLLSVPGVTQVLVYGGDLKQYQVLVNPNKLKQYNIGLNQIVTAVEDANVIIGGGYLLRSDREYLIRGIGRIQSKEELADSVITQKEGIPIYLKDVANVQIGAAFKRSYGSVDGKEAVYVAVSKQPWANTVTLEKKIIETLNGLKETLPEDIQITKTFSQADFVHVSIKNILSAIFQGAILVIIILFMFLGNWRTSIITLVAIPLSLVVAVLILKSFGQTINAMTLGGLAVAVGELVDDAIIDVENIYKRLRLNKLSPSPKPAFEVIFNASSEVRNSVVYGTFIITIVLIPVLFLGGLAGQIFKPLAWAYIIAIFASLFVALTLTPAMCFYLLSKDENLKDHETRLITNLKEKYLSLLNKVLQNPKKLFTVVVTSSLIAIFVFLFLGRTFMPELGEENLVVMAYTPPGSSLAITQNLALEMEKIFIKYPEITRAGNRAGRTESEDEPISSNLSHFDITLKSGISQKTKEKLIEKIREDFSRVYGVVAVVKSFIGEAMENVITGQRFPIVIKLYGNDLRILREKADEIKNLLRNNIKEFDGVQVEPITEIPQVHIKIKRKVASRYGLKIGDLLRTVHVAFNGLATTQRVIEGQRSFDLFVWFEEPYRDNLAVINSTLIDTPQGVKIPLGQLAEIYESTGPNIINREKVSRRISILGDAKKANISRAQEKSQELIKKKISLPKGYSLEFEGEYQLQKEANKRLFLISALVLICIYLMLSLAFKSFKISSIIMVNLPFALIGGVFAIAITSGILSLASIIGFITLFGLSTRNSILLVNRFVDIQKENPKMPIDDVIKQGALDRLPPILMTALTAAFAMLPLALFPGAGREIEHPLAIVILGGMFSATALTLLVIPVVYKRFVSRVQ